ncbi:hypothetical protein [Nitrosopumilus sp. b2]|uniref:hypothetical protein n=1 Tax=Nitrosopumilus sp. b2 TaxID=2109908 RepID=UPI0015F5CAAB|nr:hypothetical protein [Nitrosopumilus sp. b2]KAF6245482.1 hypothetical protein C6989_03365 [Nitrosopumilus sp. b2]
MNRIFLFLFLVLCTDLISSTALGDIDSPRKQMANGVSAEDVKCKNELQLMIRSNGDAICAKLSSVEKWINSQRAEIVDSILRDSENDTGDSLDEIQIGTDISPEKILVQSARDTYVLGATMAFTGESKPNTSLEVELEDSDGNKVYTDILEIDDSGLVHFEIKTDNSFTQGTYFLILKQGNDSEIVPVQIGESTGEIAAVIEKFHFDYDSKASIEIFGPISENISLTVFDSRDDVRSEDTVLLDKTGHAEYLLDLSGYKKGNYYLVLNHASEETIEEFTVGLSIGTAPIEIQVDDNYYKIGETVILIGESSDNTQILIELVDPTGEVIDKIEYYTDNDGKFIYPLELSLGKQSGFWTVKVSNGERISEITFEVKGEEKILTVQLDKEEPYLQGEFVTISGTGIDLESQAIIQIMSAEKSFELFPEVTKDGAFSEVWQIPENLAPGIYTVLVNDGIDDVTTTFQVIYKTES